MSLEGLYELSVGEDLYDLFHVNVAGGGPLHDAAAKFTALQEKYASAEKDMRSAVQGLHATWTGGAAEAAQQPFSPLIDAMVGGQTFTAGAAGTLQTQAEQFSETQRKMVKRQPLPEKPPLTLDPTDTAYYKATQQNSAITSQNWQNYKVYNGLTSANADTLGVFGATMQATGADQAPSTSVHSGQDVGSISAGGAHVPPQNTHAAGNGGAGMSGAGGSGIPGGQSRLAPAPVVSGDGSVPVGSTSAQGFLPWQSGGSATADLAGGMPAGGSAGMGGGGGGFGPIGSGSGAVAGGSGTGGQTPGGRSGAVPGENSGMGRGAETGLRGGRGAAGMGEAVIGAGGAAGRKEEDKERRRKPGFLESGEHAGEVVGKLPDTAPPVIE